MAIGLSTYQDASIREDLLSILKDVSPLKDNYVIDNLGTSKAHNTLHEWVVYHLDRATYASALPEGFTPAVSDLTQPTRSDNYTAIIDQVVKVTKTERAIETATYEDPMVFQKRKALEQLKQKMEWAVINGTGSKGSGASGVAREMAGIDGTISTHVTARASGTSISVTEIEDIMEEVWNDVGSGDVGTTLLVPFGIKRSISGLSTNITNYVNATDKLYRNISTFNGSAGEIKVVPHKDVRNTAGTSTVYLLSEEMFKVAYLREPKYNELPDTGDFDSGYYVTEFTLESLAQRASAKRTGYKKEAV